MNYICEDVFEEDSDNRCTHEGVKYNQCCQECQYKFDCSNACDYKNNWGCIALKEIK